MASNMVQILTLLGISLYFVVTPPELGFLSFLKPFVGAGMIYFFFAHKLRDIFFALLGVGGILFSIPFSVDVFGYSSQFIGLAVVMLVAAFAILMLLNMYENR